MNETRITLKVNWKIPAIYEQMGTDLTSICE